MRGLIESLVRETDIAPETNVVGCFRVCVCVCFPQCPEVRGTHCLCVDSVESSQILISFSALCHWGDSSGDSKNLQLCTCTCTCHTYNICKRILCVNSSYLWYFPTFSHLSSHLRDENAECCAQVCGTSRHAVHVEKPAAAVSASHHQDHLLKCSHAWLTPGVRQRVLWRLIIIAVFYPTRQKSLPEIDV